MQPLASGNVVSVSMDGLKVHWKLFETAGACRAARGAQLRADATPSIKPYHVDL